MTGRSAPLGLARGTVRLAASDPRWPALFRAEAARLAAALARASLPALALEHIGSTAVPGLAAKPILDVAAGYPPGADLGRYVAALVGAGYELRGSEGVPDRQLLVRGPDAARTHYLHLVEVGGDSWRDLRAFRDSLRADPGLARAYAALKRELAARHAADRSAYTTGKAAFIHTVLRTATGGGRAV